MEIPITEIKALVEYVQDDFESDRQIPPEWEGIAEKVETWLQSSGLTQRAADGVGTPPEYGATSNCVVCARRIVFCGDGVWLHCQPQDHGHARPNGAIVNPPRR